MSDVIAACIITAIVTVLGVILSNNKVTAITQNEIKRLADEIEIGNNFARKIPMMEEQIKDLSKRVQSLESGKYLR